MEQPPSPPPKTYKLTASSVSYAKSTTPFLLDPCNSIPIHILKDVSLTAHPSQILVIVGITPRQESPTNPECQPCRVASQPIPAGKHSTPTVGCCCQGSNPGQPLTSFLREVSGFVGDSCWGVIKRPDNRSPLGNLLKVVQGSIPGNNNLLLGTMLTRRDGLGRCPAGLALRICGRFLSGCYSWPKRLRKIYPPRHPRSLHLPLRRLPLPQLRPLNPRTFRKLSAYVPQHDACLPLLTVSETFAFSARLLNPQTPDL